MYRFLLTRRWLGLLAVAIVFAIGCVGLADWQLHRLAHRHQRNDQIRHSLTAAPQAASRALAVGRDPAAEQQFDPVHATGRWDVAHQLLVRLRPFEGDVGYYVLTPLVTSDGPAVLVNRGWVPAAANGSAAPAVPPPSATTVTITGRLRPTEPPAHGASPPPGQVTRIDVPRIARSLPYPVYGGFLELTRQEPRQARSPQLILAPEPSEGPHLLYAVQWVLFAGLALGGYVVLARREAADRRATAISPAPTVATRK
ncbi:MAG: SURF1 family cytochrome oxidase biogenesis protein [Actinomycetes bacterium]